MSTTTHHRARVAALSRDRQPDDPELVEARQSLTEANLVDKLVDAAPRLTAEQRTRLAGILTAGVA